MSDLDLSLLISFFLTILLAFIQIATDSKIYRLRCFFSPLLLFYIVVMTIGNEVSTLVASGLFDGGLTDSKNKLTDPHLFKGPHWLWYSFFGVFGFEILLKRINISFYGKGVLTISDWIAKAKNAAVAASLKNAADLDVSETQQMGDAFYLKYQSNPTHIHTIANSNMGNVKYSKIIKELATKPNINVELHLCYVMATEFPTIVRAAVHNQ
jgi:hypothetical protein